MSCILIAQGRIGNIEKKEFDNGTIGVNFSVASTKNEKDINGKYKTEWTNFFAYAKRAEFILKNVSVGDLVYVKANKTTREITKENGLISRYTTFKVGTALEDFMILQKKDNI